MILQYIPQLEIISSSVATANLYLKFVQFWPQPFGNKAVKMSGEPHLHVLFVSEMKSPGFLLRELCEIPSLLTSRI